MRPLPEGADAARVAWVLEVEVEGVLVSAWAGAPKDSASNAATRVAVGNFFMGVVFLINIYDQEHILNIGGFFRLRKGCSENFSRRK